MKRIMIFGRPGSGKSTFALNLSQQLSLPLYHLDKWFFVENWRERDKEDFLSIQHDFVSQERWIIDGNAMSSLEMRYARAEVVLFFCYPKFMCLLRVLKRLKSKDPRILDRAPGCPERVRWGLVKYLWGFEKRFTPLIETLHHRYPEKLLFKITNDLQKKELETFLTIKKEA
jgi:adenylate kinase family enzyme